FDQRLKFPVHDLLQLMHGQADAMVGDAILGKIVGADFFAAVTGAHHGLALFGQRILLLLYFHFIKARSQHTHSLFAVFDLRLLVLATHHRVGGNMGDAHSGIGRVHRLTARTRGAERINAQIFGFDLDVHIFSFRQDRDGDGGSVNASLGLGFWNALHAMHATLIFQARVNL